MDEFEAKLIYAVHSINLSNQELCVNLIRSAIALEKIAKLLDGHVSGVNIHMGHVLSGKLPTQKLTPRNTTEESRPRAAPNFRAVLENWSQYDWSSIGAEIELTDNYGVASVIWCGERYKRRSPENAYGAVIFFSRCVGKGEDGNNQYERLITFEPLAELKVEPISRKAEQVING